MSFFLLFYQNRISCGPAEPGFGTRPARSDTDWPDTDWRNIIFIMNYGQIFVQLPTPRKDRKKYFTQINLLNIIILFNNSLTPNY